MLPTTRRIALAVLIAPLALSPPALSAPIQSTGPLEAIELARPIPGPVVPPAGYREAVARGTRSADGAPGPGYWQMDASYDIHARLEPRSGRVSGTASIIFHNRSPEPIPFLMLHLHQNAYAPGVVRNRPAEVTGGMALARVAVAGLEAFEVESEEEVGYQVLGSLLRVHPPEAVAQGESLELEVAWSFLVPRSGFGRMGHSDHEVYFIGYWFPKIGVYDDLRGWDAEPYLGGAEFYDSFADYRAALTVPSGWTVAATGTLQNGDEVYSEQTRERLGRAHGSDDVIRVATEEDRSERRVTAQPAGGALTYRFAADGVRDFTWTASDTQVWDATSALVADRDGDANPDRVAIDTFWRPERAPLWQEQARYAKHAIEFLSRETGLTYPWPHMTSVEGDGMIGGGMEFPMLTLIGAYREREAANLYGVTVHELAHMWTPLIVGSNEKRHAWMDEGFASYLGNRGEREFFPEAPDPERGDAEGYLEVARAGAEGVMMQHGDYYEVGYGTASYAKPATLLVTLRNLLGTEVFEGAIRTYFREWAFKHPTPWDFFATIERAAGVDLDWFWSSWYFETWHLDREVADVVTGPGGSVVTIADRGFVPMPALVRIRTSGAGTIEWTIPVSHWLTGATRYEIELPASAGEVLEVQLDPDHLFPEVDLEDDVWPRAEAPVAPETGRSGRQR